MFVGNDRKITVRKAELLEKLNTGLTDHRLAFKQSVEDYSVAVVDFLESATARAKLGDFSDITIQFSAPKNYSKEFERAIAMIEMSVELEIQLDEQTFRQWALGEWNWAREFELSSAAIGGYLTKSALAKASAIR
jgi:hypothetical protein